MPNEDIITALKNSIEHGDNLESAKQVMINSGYNPKEVEEASKYVSGGVIQTQQTKPEEQLAMPSQKKSFFSKLNPFGKKKQVTKSLAQPPSHHKQQTTKSSAFPQPPGKAATPEVQQLQSQQVSTQQLKQEIASVPRTTQQINQNQAPQGIQMPSLGQSTHPLKKQLKQIKPKKPGHMKEIILLILLLALIGVLITTIVLRDTILGWFSG